MWGVIRTHLKRKSVLFALSLHVHNLKNLIGKKAEFQTQERGNVG